MLEKGLGVFVNSHNLKFQSDAQYNRVQSFNRTQTQYQQGLRRKLEEEAQRQRVLHQNLQCTCCEAYSQNSSQAAGSSGPCFAATSSHPSNASQKSAYRSEMQEQIQEVLALKNKILKVTTQSQSSQPRTVKYVHQIYDPNLRNYAEFRNPALTDEELQYAKEPELFGNPFKLIERQKSNFRALTEN